MKRGSPVISRDFYNDDSADRVNDWLLGVFVEAGSLMETISDRSVSVRLGYLHIHNRIRSHDDSAEGVP